MLSIELVGAEMGDDFSMTATFTITTGTGVTETIANNQLWKIL